jgi:hypothetical protein
LATWKSPAFPTIRTAFQVLCIGLIVWIDGVSAASSATRHVVLLFDERPELPGLAMLEAEFARTLTSNSADRIETYRAALYLSQSRRLISSVTTQTKFSPALP